MISAVEIGELPSYSGCKNKLNNLAQVNFVYGQNATGKSTLARILANPTAFPGCSLTWKDGRPLEVVVYNRDFVARHFAGVRHLPGIFTLGAQNVDINAQIDAAKAKVELATTKIENLKLKIDSVQPKGWAFELSDLNDAFKTMCWKRKQAHEDYFYNAFVGFLKSDLFRDKVLEEFVKNKSSIEEFDALKNRAAVVYNDKLKTVPKLPVLNVDEFERLETNPILERKIVGKKDVGIAALIDALDASGWVRHGREFLERSSGKCPFCQQGVPADLNASLESYFDKSYLDAKAEIERLHTSYGAEAKRLRDAIKTVERSAPEGFFDLARFKEAQVSISARLDQNLLLLQQKKDQPNIEVTLSSLKEACKAAIDLIADSNAEIDTNNRMFYDINKEKEKLGQHIWRYISGKELAADIAAYVLKRKELEDAIAGQRQRIADAEKELRDRQFELNNLERSTVNIRDAVQKINDTLVKCEFQNFSLEVTPSGDKYAIVRPGGEPAGDTLSEGEKTLITFLYFFYLVHGSFADTGLAVDRIVVIDDPVSSLDEKILHIVSSYVTLLINSVAAGGGNLKQVIILTHNVSFHMQSSHKGKHSKGSRKHWVINRSSGKVTFEEHAKNPVQSAYERLWAVIRNPGSATGGLLHIQNEVRRILEIHFKEHGGIVLEDLAEKFNAPELAPCKALILWAHAGSHGAPDGLHSGGFGGGDISMFLNIFKEIFQRTGQLGHYEMMMSQNVNVA